MSNRHCKNKEQSSQLGVSVFVNPGRCVAELFFERVALPGPILTVIMNEIMKSINRNIETQLMNSREYPWTLFRDQQVRRLNCVPS
jgi:hypothetical protein